MSEHPSSHDDIMEDASAPYFLPEVIIMILSWLPIKSLMRLQLVCKKWQAFINDHYFTQKHMDNQNVIYHYYNVERQAGVTRPDEDRFAYVHGCDGLVMLKSFSPLKFWLWNPAIHQALQIPTPCDGTYNVFISYIPAENNYKLISMYNEKESGRDGCEVFIPGQSKEWKRLTFPDILKFDDLCVKKKLTSLSAGAAVHWIYLVKEHENIIGTILSLDMGTEIFTETLIPNGIIKNIQKIQLLDWNGKLALVEIVGENLQVMELEDYKKQRWSILKKTIPVSFMKNKNYSGVNLVPLFAKEDDIWFWLHKKKIFSYSITTGQCTDIEHSEDFAFTRDLYPYKPSMIAFAGMEPDTKFNRLRPHSLV